MIERYTTLINVHIIPSLGGIALQSLDGAAIDRFYANLRNKRLASQTLRHIHTLLGQVLASAVKAKKLVRSPIEDIQTKPKPKRGKIEVLDESELARLLDHLKNKGHWLYMPEICPHCSRPTRSCGAARFLGCAGEILISTKAPCKLRRPFKRSAASSA